MPFLAAGTTDTKFLGSTGVATANSTKIYQKYKSVELGDQLHVRVENKDMIEVKPYITNKYPSWWMNKIKRKEGVQKN